MFRGQILIRNVRLSDPYKECVFTVRAQGGGVRPRPTPRLHRPRHPRHLRSTDKSSTCHGFVLLGLVLALPETI